MILPEFAASRPLSLGVELELQLLGCHDYDLTPAAPDLLRRLAAHPHRGDVKPEITTSMIEVSTAVHHEYGSLLDELAAIRDALADAGDFLNVAIAGGGTHPFQVWAEQRIFDAPRFHHLSELYGYLAKQFTVFGQHVHVGCPGPDEALHLLHSLARFVPHFIALAAASPFVQGRDTGYASARLNSVFAFPLSGRAPFLLRWADFRAYFDKMTATGVVESMKDFYWDIRPKPEYGTVEVRVCDTPLDIGTAAALAGYIQAVARYIIVEQRAAPLEDDYLVYTFNRFQACRFGLDGSYVDPRKQTRRVLRDEIAESLDRVAVHARELGAAPAIDLIREILADGNGAERMRRAHAETADLHELMRRQATAWMQR